MEAAAHGALWESGDETTPLKTIRQHPEVFELRRKALSKPLRFYHAEPEDRPSALIALHKHIKTGTSEQDEIEYTAKRYLRWAEGN